jgi:hypothetical protein
MQKFEKLIEYIINEDEAKAKALFHDIVIAKSRDIYESLVDEDQFPVQRGRGAERLGDEIEDQNDVIDGDQQGMHEDDEFAGDDDGAMDDDMDGDEFGDDDMDGDEFGGDDDGAMGDDMGDEASVEDRVMDLEDAIDELKAEFDSLMAGEEAEEENMPGIHDAAGEDDMGGDDEFDADEEDMGGEELGDEADSDGQKFGEASIYGESKKTDKPWTDMKGNKRPGTAVKGDKYDGKTAEKEEKAKKVKESRKSPADLMREYVEKVTAVKPVEGDAIGSGGTKSPINSKSTQIGGKNDMGGTTKNIAQGGAASDRDSNTSPKKPSNYLTKGETKMGQDKYENSPGANTKGYKDKRTVKREQEGQTTKESVPVVKKSFNPGGSSGYKA